MTQLMKALNRTSIDALRRMTITPNTMRLWIENGKITGFTLGEKLYKENPHTDR